MRQRETGVDAKRRESRACEREPHRIGQPQPARGERDQDRKAEQGEGANEQDVHGRLSSGPTQSEKLALCCAASIWRRRSRSAVIDGRGLTQIEAAIRRLEF
jgi:hypothetical protein